MKSLSVAAAFPLLMSSPATADEVSYVVCCVDYVVETCTERLHELKTQTEARDSEVGESFLNRRKVIRTAALAIVRRLAEERGYDYVFETGRTRSELIADHSLGGMLVEFTCPDISDEVSRLLEDQIDAEQAGAGQPATRPESDSEGDDKPQPEAEGRSR
jgi:hypothetical protein